MQQCLHLTGRDTTWRESETSASCFARRTIRTEDVRIQLQPQITQCVRRLIVIANGFRTMNRLVLIVEGHINVVVHFLLPIVRARFASRTSVRVRRRKDFLQLSEFVILTVLLIGERLCPNRIGSDPQNQRSPQQSSIATRLHRTESHTDEYKQSVVERIAKYSQNFPNGNQSGNERNA